MENNEKTVDTEEVKTMTFDEILASNPEYQSEFDRRMAKSNKTYLETEKANWEKEYSDKLAKEKSEAEKLARMNTEQQLNYKIKQLEEEIALRDSKINASQLKETTTDILIEKGIPSEYLKMFDFTKETADTINSKVELLSNIRSQDLQNSINKTLRQESPKNVISKDVEEIDPYIEGFKSEF